MTPPTTPDDARRRRRANNALGLGLVAAVILLETVFADNKNPNPASPYVWAVLGSAVAACALVWLRSG